MSKPQVFVTRRIPDAGLEMLQAEVDMEVWEGELPPPYETLQEKITNVDGILTLLTDRIDAPLIESGAGRLKVISQYAVGFDNIDVETATRLKIPVGHTPGVLTNATADFAWTLLMAAARRIVEADAVVRGGGWKTWSPKFLLGPEVAGATLGIIGFGRIGQAVARRAGGFGMRILYHDIEPKPEAERELGAEYVSLEQLLHEADFVTIHTILSDETHHLISEAQFKLMKPSAILVNTARGPIVDQDALYRALAEGTIAYAALDVTVPEPIQENDPLLGLKNVIIAPHIASASIQARRKMATMSAANLLAGLKGEPLPNCVNPQVYA
jgi:glyoxylate reductase